LYVHWNLSHFIQKDGPAFRGFKTSGPILHGSGKSASHMAEEFALEQLPRNGRAIDSNQRAIFASAAAVDFVGHQFFARSGLAQNEHGSFRGSDDINLADDVFQRRTLPDQIAEGLGFHHGLLQVNILEFRLR
jgi:hypothetical protein